MRVHTRITFFVVMVSIAVLGTRKGNAFALLGPFQPWMQETNGLRQPGDIGGPMCISNAYRWNVPVVTYGFDKSFLNYFGTNGEAAVEGAIEILNDLPPASQMDLDDYPFNSMSQNFYAQSLNMSNLKSLALPALLEQLGLASPARYTFVLRQWNPVFISPITNGYDSQLFWPSWVFPDYISQLNFDPQTLLPSPYVNNVLYTAAIATFGDENEIIPIVVDPVQEGFNAVADAFYESDFGTFYTGLTYDDVGGLRYLLSTNNVAYETLLPGVVGVGTNANCFVNGAWRPGIDKITFIPQPVDPQSGAFLPTTNCWTDTYFTNGVLMQQQLARIVSQPDFLFSVRDIGFRTGTTNWLNNAAANGNTNGAGPGVIPPPVLIAFPKSEIDYFSQGSISDEQAQQVFYPYASFDGSTNPPVVYPIPQTGTNQIALYMSLTLPNFQKNFVWKSCSLSGTQYAMQTSTDLQNWITLFSATNNGTVYQYSVTDPASTTRFYRFIQQ